MSGVFRGFPFGAYSNVRLNKNPCGVLLIEKNLISELETIKCPKLISGWTLIKTKTKVVIIWKLRKI